MTRYTPQWLQAGSYAAAADRRLIAALWPAPASAGCAVTPSSGMTVNVAVGQVAVPSQNSTGSTLCTSDAVEPVTLTAAPASGTNRYDLIVCQPRGNDLDGGANNDFVFTYVTGTAAASPTVPAVPAGAVGLAQIYVPGGSAAVTAGNITDTRPGNLPVPVVPSSGDTSWTAASGFTNGWASLAAPNALRYRLVGTTVHMQGVVTGGTANSAVLTLPAGYRPTATVGFATANGASTFAFFTITSAGVVQQNTGTTTNLYLSCSFSTL
jgi:hypothetical protein